jgi:hypothetical protein
MAMSRHCIVCDVIGSLCSCGQWRIQGGCGLYADAIYSHHTCNFPATYRNHDMRVIGASPSMGQVIRADVDNGGFKTPGGAGRTATVGRAGIDAGNGGFEGPKG